MKHCWVHFFPDMVFSYFVTYLLYLLSCWCIGVFRECAGARCVLSMVQHRVCRTSSLGIIQQLILSSGGDEDFASLLGLMHTSSPDAIQLKMDIIKVGVSTFDPCRSAFCVDVELNWVVASGVVVSVLHC